MVEGVLAAIDVLVEGALGRIHLNLNVLCLWIGAGLLARRPVWRTWALVHVGIGVTVLPLLAFWIARLSTASVRLFGTEVASAPVSFALAFAAAAFAVEFWRLRVLVGADVREVFHPRERSRAAL